MKKSAHKKAATLERSHKLIYRYYSGKGGRRQMINIDDFGKSIRITGHPEQIAMEFEFAARGVKAAFRSYLGNDAGDTFYKEILAMAEKSEDEIEYKYQRIRAENPELAEKFDRSELMRDLRDCLGRT